MKSLALVVLFVAGCSSAPDPNIAVQGAPMSVASLAGTWSGTYRIADGSRRGVVRFDLAPRDSVATGSVIMQPGSQTTNDALAPRGDVPHPEGAGLVVRFVRVANGRVRGELDPYTDPECACTVHTVFEGRVKDRSIEGTFVIKNDRDGTTRAGDWSVTRQP